MDKSILTSLKNLEEIVAKVLVTMVTKDDLKNFATKEDLEKQGETITNDIGDVVTALFTAADEQKADRSEVKRLEIRVERLENKTAA